MKIIFTFALALTLAIVSASCAPQSSQPSPNISSSPSSSHSMNGMQKMDEMNERGDKVMGFDHMKTTHHFRFLVDGGAIEVEANDAADTASRDQIRQHLEHICKMFADGNFNAPMMIYGQNPSGVPTMQKLKGEIKYQFEETEKGARVAF